MNLQTVLLAAAGGWENFLFIGLMVVVFWLFMIRPQQKRQKEIKQFRESLKVGDTVISSGGIYGKIKEMKEDYVMLEIAGNTVVKIDRGYIFATPADSQQTK